MWDTRGPPVGNDSEVRIETLKRFREFVKVMEREDWFYTADRLRKGGLMLIDDAQMRSVAILAEYMGVDPGWQLIRNFSGKTLAFEKTRDSIHDVAWHMQPFTVGKTGGPTAGSSLLRRATGRLKRLVS